MILVFFLGFNADDYKDENFFVGNDKNANENQLNLCFFYDCDCVKVHWMSQNEHN